ncbi:hypothetical protein Y032_0002g958 [Ancylostoma ceylanicum]|uniref:Uncharacterized protein n=1 Tax=Ancylostoma ceylanicum TaxID=53326 RepID=A0A016W409_9BILA|nr:hypothetical protein Y032_0002g958 [Ancylostoma ceylanicum]
MIDAQNVVVGIMNSVPSRSATPEFSSGRMLLDETNRLISVQRWGNAWRRAQRSGMDVLASKAKKSHDRSDAPASISLLFTWPRCQLVPSLLSSIPLVSESATPSLALIYISSPLSLESPKQPAKRKPLKVTTCTGSIALNSS